MSDAIPAKHVLFVMDSCYSGLGLTRGAGMNQYLREMARRTARQMLTAGGADQEVADNGPNGHSVFTWTLLQALEGRADLNADGYISAAELVSYVTPGVSAISRQTPAFGSLPQRGRRVRLRAAPRDRLPQSDVGAARSGSDPAELRTRSDPPGSCRQTARNDKLREEVAAARAQQTGEAANNAGYLLSKLGRVDEARRWHEKTIEIAPRRAVVYVNLGDLYYEQNRRDEARRMYEKYLEVSPNAQNAATIRARLGG